MVLGGGAPCTSRAPQTRCAGCTGTVRARRDEDGWQEGGRPPPRKQGLLFWPAWGKQESEVQKKGPGSRSWGWGGGRTGRHLEGPGPAEASAPLPGAEAALVDGGGGSSPTCVYTLGSLLSGGGHPGPARPSPVLLRMLAAQLPSEVDSGALGPGQSGAHVPAPGWYGNGALSLETAAISLHSHEFSVALSTGTSIRGLC